MDKQTQVLVIGGGPAGSTAATLLARQGFRVTLLERDIFPREHVGESLLPSFRTILDLMGAREKVEAHGFVKKYGAYLDWGVDEWEIRFGEPEDPNTHYAWQVVRSEFDKLLLDHSRSQGVDVHENTEVRGLTFDGDRPVSAAWARRDDPSQAGEIAFDFVVDASGRAGLLANRYLKSRRYNKGFQNVALYGYWKGAQPLDKAPPGGLLVGAVPDGWIWGIPLHNGTLSVGLVVHKDGFKTRREGAVDVEALYRGAIAETPLIAEVLQGAELVSELYSEQDFSYVTEHPAGPGFFIVGDAAAFLDPLLASGVHLATFSSLLAAASICSVMRGEMQARDAADYFENTYRLAYVRFLVLVSSLYRNYRGKESLFWNANQMTHYDAEGVDVFRAFRHLVMGMQDIDEAGEGARAAVMSVMERLVESYFPRDRDTAWWDSLSEEERARILEEVRPLNAATEYALSPETAIDGMYVRTSPTLGLARVEAGVGSAAAEPAADA